jgi:hypothetical protein
MLLDQQLETNNPTTTSLSHSCSSRRTFAVTIYLGHDFIEECHCTVLVMANPLGLARRGRYVQDGIVLEVCFNSVLGEAVTVCLRDPKSVLVG